MATLNIRVRYTSTTLTGLDGRSNWSTRQHRTGNTGQLSRLQLNLQSIGKNLPSQPGIIENQTDDQHPPPVNTGELRHQFLHFHSVNNGNAGRPFAKMNNLKKNKIKFPFIEKTSENQIGEDKANQTVGSC
jgi:hypothetical protein